jgi:flagellar basal body-associated protein FliL
LQSEEELVKDSKDMLKKELKKAIQGYSKGQVKVENLVK